MEFHPKYDPVNWTLADGTAVYAATIPADSSRTTVYGIVVDDPGQLRLFGDEPTVEITDGESAGGGFSFQGASSQPLDEPEWEGAEAADADPDTNPERGESDGREAADPEGEESEESPYGPYFEGPGIELDGTQDFGLGDAPRSGSAGDSTVESLVAELRRRELAEEDRAVLLEALGLEEAGPMERRLEALAAELDALRDEVAGADRQAADVDRLEGRLEAAESVQEALASAVAELEAELEREARWRSRLRKSLAEEHPPADPDRD